MITHYDLFAGIGGFSLALEEIFTDEPIRHVFCEWERFPTNVLKQHWPDGEFWGDIAELVTYTESTKRQQSGAEPVGEQTGRTDSGSQSWSIVTGGFPCQPFSHAGRRKGTADDRYQWPNMFAVIRNVKPKWVVAENVRGLVTWNEGMVLETVCADLESEGYEVQPFIIPAVAVNAPHRRDRVWIIAHTDNPGNPAGLGEVQETDGEVPERNDDAEPSDTSGQLIADTKCHGLITATKSGSHAATATEQPAWTNDTINAQGADSLRPDSSRAYPDWNRQWQEVAFATCDDAMDDGLPRLVDGVSYSRARWRKDSLKAYGNGIVPEVAMNIMRAIKETL